MSLTLLNPWMLLALPAVAAPVLLHLLRRRNVRRVRFPAAVLLMRPAGWASRRRRLEDQLLLALRVLIVCLAVLLVARPVIRVVAPADDERGVMAAVAIVLDDTASLGARVTAAGNATRFDRARQAGLGIIARLALGSEVVIVRASQPERLFHTFDPSEAAARLKDAEQTLRSRPLAPAIRAAADRLRQSKLAARILYVLSDLSPPSLEGLEHLDALPPNVALRVLDLSSPAANWAVTAVRAPVKRVTPQAPLSLVATISRLGIENENENDPAPQSRTVVLEIDGSDSQRQVVTLRPGEQTDVAFRFFPERPGTLQGRVRLDAAGNQNENQNENEIGDALPIDDQRAFAFQVQTPIRVQVVRAAEADAVRAPAHAVLLALAPFEAGRHAQLIAAEPVEPAALLRGEPARQPTGQPDVNFDVDVDVIVLAGDARLSDPAWLRLTRFVARGGGLLAFTSGDGVPSAAAAMILPAQPSGKVAELATRLRLAPESHPVLDPFRNGANGGLEQVLFRRYARLQSPDEATEEAKETRKVRVLARFKDGSPALLARRVGRGRVLMFAALPQVAWTDLPRSMAFVPFLHEAVAWLSGRGASAINVTPGAVVTLAVRPGEENARLNIFAPGRGKNIGQPRPQIVLVPIDFDSSSGVFTATDALGLYQVRLERISGEAAEALTESSRQWAFAVGLDPAESDLRRGDDALLRRLASDQQQKDVAGAIIARAQEQGNNRLFEALPRAERQLTGWLLLALIALLFAESCALVAGRLARRRDVTVPDETLPPPPPPSVARARAAGARPTRRMQV